MAPAMNGQGTHRPDHGRQAAFLLWGWAMVLLVLLSAAPTSAQPRTRLVGSAFDPATVSVAVSPKKADPEATVKYVRGRSGDGAAGAAPEWVLTSGASLAGQERAASALLAILPEPSDLPARAQVRPPPARAPPHR